MEYDLIADDDLEISPRFVKITIDYISKLFSDAEMFLKYHLNLSRLRLINLVMMNINSNIITVISNRQIVIDIRDDLKYL